MRLEQFKELVNRLPYGKRLPTAVYILRPALLSSSDDLHQEIGRAMSAANPPEGWNLLKLHTNEYALTFLSYPDFDTDPHPALGFAAKIGKTSCLDARLLTSVDFS